MSVLAVVVRVGHFWATRAARWRPALELVVGRRDVSVEPAAAQPGRAPEAGQSPLIWGNLLHLSYNMWRDRPVKEDDPRQGATTYQPYLRFDEKLWEELTKRMADVGMNLVVIDLGDGVQYESHPEIAVQNAWSVERLRKELARLRKLGLEPIPKLNFSATPRRLAGRLFAPGVHAALLQSL